MIQALQRIFTVPATVPVPRVPVSTTSQPRETVHALAQGDHLQLSVSRTPALPEHVKGELLIRMKPGVDPKQWAFSQGNTMGLQVIEKLPSPRKDATSTPLAHVYRMRFDAQQNIQQVLTKLQHNPQIIYAEPNYVVRVAGQKRTLPNDLHTYLWGMHNTGQDSGKIGADIHALDAWKMTTGKPTTLIGVIDTGVDYTHPELADNIWTNPGEVAGDGQDNDNNGYIDDVHGWDFANNDNDPMDRHGHGTHVSGTIAAKGNNGQGVVGVNWQAKIMPLKFLGDSGAGTTADAIKAVVYATDNGVQLTNNSWGGGGYSLALRDAIAMGPLFVAAAGNDDTNTDLNEHYPSTYELPNIVSVAASTRTDERASFSNYGRKTVDLAAPGDDIYSTLPGNKYGFMGGTSMAAPHVSGVAGLILSQYPHSTPAEIKQRLMGSVDRLESLAGKTVSGGRLNAAAALKEDHMAPAAVPQLRVTEADHDAVTLKWIASGDDGMQGTARRYDIRYATEPLTEDNWPNAVEVGHTLAPLPAGNAQSLTVTGLLAKPEGQTYYLGVKAVDAIGQSSPLVSVVGKTSPAVVILREDAEKEPAAVIPDTQWGKLKMPNGNQVWSDSPNGLYPNEKQAILMSKSLDLSKLQKATLMFQHQFELEKGYDFGQVEVSNNQGQDWQLLQRYTGVTNWRKENLDLTPYAGQNIQLRFRTVADGSVNAQGWDLDDLLVVGQAKN